ncbi:transketolase-like protein 2 [Coccinella septempunctata]|uniref:transketolase-like protein 2 n=1 Tax=Coccinella septempunctata TaxID=41139 RepID=UPI001D06A66C|nr:transketolase-like protein 2 [Coccinella septempunctata]
MAAYQRLPFRIVEELNDLANRIRLHVVATTSRAKGGHPTSCSSIAEILSALFFQVMRYKVSNLKDPCSDRMVLSKGHAAPALYAVWAEVGLFPTAELMNFRKFGSNLEGHPTPKLDFIDVATGGLGHGLSHAAGMAYMGKYLDKAAFRVYCIVGDGETSEGMFWESVNFCSYYELDNLCLVVDVNRLGRSDQTPFGYDCDVYRRRFDAFGWFPIVVDGHNVDELCKSFHNASLTKGKPSVLIAKTTKGKNFPEIENESHWHGKHLGEKTDNVMKSLKRMIRNTMALKISHQKPLKDALPRVHLTDIKLASAPLYKFGEKINTRSAFASALVKLGQMNPRILVMDSDCQNVSYTNDFKVFDPSRFIQCFSAEQNMIGVAVGLASRGRSIVFCVTYASALTKAHDCIRMAAISRSRINIAGIHAGVSAAEDGACVAGLEDLALFRSVPDCVIFYPSDAISTERAVELAANYPGLTYIRLTRPAVPVIYSTRQVFEIGKANLVRENIKDKILVVTGGVTLSTVIEAYEELLRIDIFLRVMDVFTVKPIDKDGIIKHGRECNNRILVVEDHYHEGGLGEAVKSAVAGEEDMAVKHIAINSIPGSGAMCDQFEHYSLTCDGVKNGIGELLCICDPCL